MGRWMEEGMNGGLGFWMNGWVDSGWVNEVMIGE